jgi:small conductance mechanosensitive channel
MEEIAVRIQEFLVTAVAKLPRVGLLLLLFIMMSIVVRIALRRARKLLINRATERGRITGEQEKRARTIGQILSKVAMVTLWIVAVTVILGELGVDIGPIIAAAGVLGLAVSFGAQNLVRDVIAGILILAENQLRVGDVAIVNGTGGLVEAINLRTIVLRDLAGTVHVFPNGVITSLSNMTKDWSGYVFDLGVGYETDVDAAIDVVGQVGEAMRGDPDYGPKIIEPVEVFGLDQFGDSALVIKGRIKTKPIEQWAVGREFNRRIKKAFDEAGIEIPFPQRTVTFAGGDQALRLLLRRQQPEA